MRDAVAYASSAAAGGEWSKILCARPFVPLATLLLTFLRVSGSHLLYGFEVACAALYSTPTWIAALAVLVGGGEGCSLCHK